MHRRLCSLLSTKQNLSGESLRELQVLLKANYFREFVSALDLTSIIPFIQVQQCFDQTVIFDHGQPIDKYYFLVSGKVFLEYRSTKPNEKVAIEILDGLNIIGEYFYDSSSKRIAKAETIPDENPTLLFSIDKAPFDFFYEPQILQYSQLKEKCSQVTGVSAQILENKGLYRSMGWARFRFGCLIPNQLFANAVCLILKGECVLNKSSGILNMMEGDYINLEGYFKKKEIDNKNCQYRVKSSQLEVCILHFEFIEKLPQKFAAQLSFIHQCHDMASVYRISRSPDESHIEEEQANSRVGKVKLPTVERNTTPFSSQGKSFEFLTQFAERLSHKHKPRKSRSIIDRKQTLLEEIQSFRKRYCLGYSSQDKLVNGKKQQIRQPRGYFLMPSIQREKREKSNDSLDQKRREWVSYIRPKQEQQVRGSKTKDKQNLNEQKKGERFRNIFDRYNNLQSLDRFGQTREIKKIVLKGRTKMFQFPDKTK